MLQCRPLHLLVTGSVTAIACHMKLRDSARTSLGQGERDKHCTPGIFPKPTVSVSYDVAIIGGGVIGLAVAHKLAESNQSLRIVVIEKEDSVAAGASSGNSGLGCTGDKHDVVSRRCGSFSHSWVIRYMIFCVGVGYDAPVGSLERELLRRSIRLHPQFYRSLGLHAGEGGHVRKSGSLVVAWNDEQGKAISEVHDIYGQIILIYHVMLLLLLQLKDFHTFWRKIAKRVIMRLACFRRRSCES